MKLDKYTEEELEIDFLLNPFKEKLEKIKSLTDTKNWYGFNCDPLSDIVFDRATSLFTAIMANNSSIGYPKISPCEDGSLHLRWKHDGFKFVIEITVDRYDCFFTGADDKFKEFSSKNEDIVIDSLLKWFGFRD